MIEVADVLAFERATAGVSIARKARWVRMQFGVSLTKYLQRLHHVLEDPAVRAAAPDVVERLLRLRDERRRIRQATRLQAPAAVPRRQRSIPFPDPARPRAREVRPMEQLPLIDTPRLERAERHLSEASAELGALRRDSGMAAASGAADPEWRVAVDAAIEQLAATGEEFTSEDVRRIAGDPPDHPNAMGARFHWAARRGIIHKIGYRKATRASLHAHPIAVWQGRSSKGKEGEDDRSR